uniref:Uncharacterized protein n=1 Tax=Lepeophtheirus salmonis TaxID=72036 RepID=A0A0K2VIN9_LEPSM
MTQGRIEKTILVIPFESFFLPVLIYLITCFCEGNCKRLSVDYPESYTNI